MSALRWKYVEMRALREAHARGDDDDPRPRLQALAAQFPGALRELDELPLETIDARIASLEAAEQGDCAPPWAQALAGYHGWMRAALAARRAAGPGRDRERALAWIEDGYRPVESDPSRHDLEASLESVLRPPGGRLSRWVFGLLADQLGGTAGEMEALLFPHAHRSAAKWSDQ